MAIIYVDSLDGLDSNPGTESLPKATYKAAELIAVAGDEIALKAGRCYAPVNGFYPRIKKNNLKLRAYGLTVGADPWIDYPTLDGLTYENSGSTGWTHEGDGVWSKVFGTAKAKRIWFGSNSAGVLTTQRTIGTAYRRTPHTTADNLTAIKAALNSTDRWHPSGSSLGWKLYVYTGSTTVNPATFYAGLAILICDGATIGAEEGIFITQCSGARVSNIHVRGAHGDSGRIASGTTDTVATDDNIIQNCISSCNGVANVWSIRVGAESNENLRKKISNSYLLNIKADSKSSTYEQDPTVSYNNISSMDMFTIYGNTENCHIWDFEAINSSHVGATLGGQEFNEPVNCSILRGYIKFDSWVTYGRGIATSRMTNSVIGACVIDGQNVRSQFADGHVVGNKWINSRASIRKAATDEWAAVECYVYDYGNPAAGSYRYETRQPRDLLIAHNVVDRPMATGGAYPLLFTTYSSTYPVTEPNPPINANTVRVYNNIVILTEARSWIASFANGGAVQDQLVKNNIVFTGAGNADATVRWDGITVGMNSRTGHVGNMAADPLLSATLTPLTGSPAIRAGIPFTPTYSGLNGLTFNASTPTIGAYEMAPTTVGYGSGASVSPAPVIPTSPVPLGQVVNQRDVILQSADPRLIYLNNRAVLLMPSATLFQETDSGTSPESITLTAFMLGIRGEVEFTTQPEVPMVLTDNTVTISGTDMTTDTLIVQASVMFEGLEYTATQTLRKLSNDSTAPLLALTPSAQVFLYDKAGNVTPSSITLTATTRNLVGAPTFSSSGTTLAAGSDSFQKVVTPASMTADNATVEVSLGGLLDRVTIIKVREGVDSINALLTNEAHTVPCDSSGNVLSYSGASTVVKIYEGIADVTSLWAFTTAVTGCTVSPASIPAGTTSPTFSITNFSADVGYVDITATRAGYPSQTKRFTVTKSKAGTSGSDAKLLYLAASSQVFQIPKSGSVTPSSITFTSSGQNLAGSPSFTTSPTMTLTGSGNTRSLAYASMTADSVTVTVTQDGLTDTVTVVKVREGADGVDATVALLTNESHTVPADSSGTVTSYTGASTMMKVYTGINDSTALYSFSASATSCTVSPTSASGTLTPTFTVSAMTADVAYVDITASRAGYPNLTKRFTVAKSKAGSNGGTGARGAGHFYITGSSWPDGNATADNAATAACPGGRVVDDRVTMSNGSTFVMTKYWTGSAWTPDGKVVDGNLIVTESVTAAKINSNGLTIRDASGNIILGTGATVDISTYIASLNADKITAGTITGRMYRTAAANQRIEINNANDNKLKAYNSAGTMVCEIGGTTGTIYVPSAVTTYPAIYATIGSSGSLVAAIYGGSSGNGTGVGGQSSSGYGVDGYSNTGVGVYAKANTGDALEIAGGTNGIVQTGGGSNYLRSTLPSVDNTYSLGASGSLRWTAVYATSSTITTSDVTTKTRIEDETLGLKFINDLRPVTYLQKVAENIVTDNFVEVEPARTEVDEEGNEVEIPAVVENRPTITQRAGTRPHHGLIAQEVKAVLDAHGHGDAAIWSLSDKDDPTSLQALRYEELIAPLIKAVQELSSQVTSLKAEVASLKQS